MLRWGFILGCPGQILSSIAESLETVHPTLSVSDMSRRRRRASQAVIPTSVGRALVAAAAAATSQVGKRRRRLRKRLATPRVGPGMLRDYYQTLEDPFEYGPIRLGYDCYVPTAKATAYSRSSLTVNADGSFGLALQPSIVSSLLKNVAGAGVATWTTNNMFNYQAIQGQGSEARVVSGGMRVIALFPTTAAPGVLFSGVLPDYSRTYMVASTISNLAQYAGMEISPGTRSSAVTIRPKDNDSFVFRSETVGGYATTDIPVSPMVCIVGQGFPAGTVVWYEAVLNLELLPGQDGNTLGISADSPPEPGLSDYFPSIESVMTRLRPLLGSAVTLDAAEIGLRAAGMPAVAGALHGARSAFGHGRSTRRALVSGASSARQSAQTTDYITIEEVKEN